MVYMIPDGALLICVVVAGVLARDSSIGLCRWGVDQAISLIAALDTCGFKG